ncbi:hypothetical protein DP107_01765 [Haloglomus irregulare]|uniref:Uncharacterized protein n=2 Tax=Haloglomus irregulare TaxID=2234134 RepID=A0A554NF53_9EURY|nr:hypothetical protein DP107_01765 [Haloglomus irregulare]
MGRVAGLVVSVRAYLADGLSVGSSAAAETPQSLASAPPVPDAVRDHPTRTSVLADALDHFHDTEDEDLPPPDEEAIRR